MEKQTIIDFKFALLFALFAMVLLPIFSGKIVHAEAGSANYFTIKIDTKYGNVK